MSEWVKWKPCRGYGCLLAATAMPTVLEILLAANSFFLLSYKLPTPMSCKHQVFVAFFK
jgi:hypothetical protein